ncbi:MAG: hypothetical protein JXA54_11415 [Candidatus Heimdallarchaeota archaeon]|nr:hypothetical protein [Candidatus Heimdallarchaeota archaeon]
MEQKIDSMQEHLQHIANVMYERVLLYEKRYREIRRAVKAKNRLGESLEPRTTFLMLEAEIQYTLNLAGYQTIKSIIMELNSNNKWLNFELLSRLEKDKDFREIFFKKITEIDSIIKRICIKKTDLVGLIEVVLNLDEDFQRNIIGNFISNNIKYLVTIVFKDLVILDNDYTEQVIKNYKKNPPIKK